MPDTALSAVDEPAARALAAVRREIARRVAEGPPEGGMPSAAVVAALEARPADREALEVAARERRRIDPGEGCDSDCGLRAHRRRRMDEAHHALDALVLAGELMLDGPGRVHLPGFGRTAWRAIALLRDGSGGPAGAWAGAVADGPAGDLGEAAPAFLRDLRPDPGLAEAARDLHAWEAARQDARHALITASASLGRSRERGEADAARVLGEECKALDTRLRAIDAEIDAAWKRGLAASRSTIAGSPPRSPGSA